MFRYGPAALAQHSSRWTTQRSAPHPRRVPTALRHGPYRVYFYSYEPGEPAHMHVDRDNLSAKFWLQPLAEAENYGFSEHELRRIERILRANAGKLLKAWNDHFAT